MTRSRSSGIWLPLERLCELAAEKDPGFDRRVLADAFAAAIAHPDAAFAELGLGPEATAALRASAAQWRDRRHAAPRRVAIAWRTNPAAIAGAWFTRSPTTPRTPTAVSFR